MRWIVLGLALMAAGCTSDAEDARQACGGDSVTYAAEVARCRAAYMAELENRRAQAGMILGAGLMNYGAARAAAPTYVPTTTNCYGVGGMVQCTTY